MQKSYKSALVIEGGALRGVHTAGILDVFMRYGIRFPYVIGVSAGALNTYNYISNQPGRTAKILLEYIRDDRYLNLKHIPNQKESAFGFDFMFYGLQEYLPFDEKAFNDPEQAFTVVATDLSDGKAVYFRKGECSDMYKAGAASSSLPLISPPVELDGHRCLDGGLSDPIPFLKALEDGCEKVVVVLTRHKGFRKRKVPFAELEAAKQLYKNAPDLLESILTMNDRYNATLDLLEQLEDEGKIYVIRPSKEIDISLLERNTESLGALYREGVRDSENALFGLMQYLGETNDAISFHADGSLVRERVVLEDSVSEKILLSQVERSIENGPRITGNDAHRKFLKYIKDSLKSMGLPYYSDPIAFRYREAKKSSLSVLSGGRKFYVPCKALPYTGSTGNRKITGELYLVKDLKYRFLNAHGKIAIFHVDDKMLSSAFYEKIYTSPDNLQLPDRFGIQSRTDSFPFLNMAKTAGVKGLVLVWDGGAGLPEEYLPYAQDFADLPCVWVSGSEGKHLEKMLEANPHSDATLYVEVETEENVWCENIYCVLPGSDSGESIIVNTHTEGLNCIEENGFAALLSLMDSLKDKSLRRTHIFVFSSGKYRLPYVKGSTPGTGSIGKWLSMHPDFWDGKDGHLKAVAAITAEHLGYADSPEVVFSSNPVMDQVYKDALMKRKTVNSVLLRARNEIFGEGQPLHGAGIPVLAFAADDLSLLAPQSEKTDLSFSASLMKEQIQTILDCLMALEEIPKEAIGRSEKHPFLTQVIPERFTKVFLEDEHDGDNF